ncbi:uncharacterized protein [Salvelinus alpinus]|uniref:uncharacterized protein n=1 Tax=Salvelinus alpinus TaxID=8036 RepID=UPI0039FDAABB
MPRSNHGDVHPRGRTPPVTLDWIDGKNVKLLRVANHKEAFRFKKLNQALSSMESLHKNCWLQEERRVKQNLRRLTSVSPTFRSQTLFQRPSDNSRAELSGGGSRVQLPTCPPSHASREDCSSCSLNSPLFRIPQSTAAPSPRTSHRSLILPLTINGDTMSPHHLWPRDTLSENPSSSRGGRCYGGLTPRPSQHPSTLSLTPSTLSLDGSTTPLLPTPSLLALLPPQLSPELHGLQEAVLGFPLLQKRVRELITRARATEQERQDRRNLTLRPPEALRCRYLRLSESNIRTLLQQCKDSGIDMDIHPHMKDSDIDISKLFKDSPPPSPR